MSTEISSAAARKRDANARRRSPSKVANSDGNGPKSTRLTLIGVKVDPALCRAPEARPSAPSSSPSRSGGRPHR
jgi:hypothetical protein